MTSNTIRILDAYIPSPGCEAIQSAWSDRLLYRQRIDDLKPVICQMCDFLRERINLLHGLSLTEREANILLAPYVGTMVHVISERCDTLQKYSKSGENLIEIGNAKSCCKSIDTKNFLENIVESEWNARLIYELANFLNLPVKSDDVSIRDRNKNSSKNKKYVSTRLFKILDIVFLFFCGYPKIFITRSGGVRTFIRRCLILKTWPFFEGYSQLDIREQKFLVDADQPKELMPLFLWKFLPEIFKYSDFRSEWSRYKKMKLPLVIFDQTAYFSDDSFKFFVAASVNQGSKFVIGQHGGNYGQCDFSFSQDHQLEVCDNFVSWGWKTGKKNGNKILPLGCLKFFPTTRRVERGQKKILVVLCDGPSFPYYGQSFPMGGIQWRQYASSVAEMLNMLPHKLKEHVEVRPYKRDYGNNILGIIRKAVPWVKLDLNPNFYQSIRESSFTVVTYNATAYLETFVMGVPTLLFWDTRQWELSEEAWTYFDALKRVGIFHDQPGSCVRTMIEWANTSQKDLQASLHSEHVSCFINRYAKTNSRLDVDLKNSLDAVCEDSRW